MAKRPKILGRGADIFLGGGERVMPEQNIASTPAYQHAGNDNPNPYPKATYYLPLSLQRRLEEVWLNKRRVNHKIRKSDIVREALERYLGQEG